MDIGIRVPLFSSVTYHEPFIGEPDAISQFTINHWQTIDCLLVWSLDLVRNLSAQMWCKGSKLVACHFLDNDLDTQIGERDFRVCNSSIQLVSVNLP